MPKHDLLAGLARAFAGKIQDLLNSTICDGLRISTVASADPNLVLVGHGLGKPTLVTEPFPVGIGRRKPTCSLDVSFRMRLDEADRYLTVVSSLFAVYANDTDHSCLCHFDYERDKVGYPEAHLQVPGTSPALVAIAGPDAKRGLDKLHFPVGGRRYRPILEDVIEFLVAERLAKGRSGWQEVLNRERENYYRVQLQAAIRRDPHVARLTLDTITIPPIPQQVGRTKRPAGR